MELPTGDYLAKLAFAPGEFEKLQSDYDSLFLKISELLEQSISNSVKENIRNLVREMFPDISDYKLEQIVKDETQSIAGEFTSKMLPIWFEELHKIK